MDPIIAGAIIAGGAQIGSQMLDNYTGKQNREMQYDFAKHGLSWKVQDAKNAGLHPLAALGANTLSFNPVPVNTSSIRDMGQNIMRATMAQKTPEDKKIDELKIAEYEERIRNMGLQNVALYKGIQNAPGSPPPNNVNALGIVQGQTDSITEEALPPTGHKYIPNELETSQSVGVASGLRPLEAPYPHRSGYIFLGPTQSSSEVLTEGFAQIPYWLHKAGAALAGAAKHNAHPYREPARKHRVILRKFRETLPKQKGWIYRYNPIINAFKIVKDDGKDQFYLFGATDIKY